MDNRFSFTFAGENWCANADGALFWPRRSVMLVADLHLEKGSWFASLGQPLPPYDSRATMDRMAAAAAQWQPAEIWCLGDSFHDHEGQARLDRDAATAITALASRHRWRFIAGNHDGLPDGLWGTGSVEEVLCDGIVFRHEQDMADPRPQVSGHFHPKVSVQTRGGTLRRPCFACGDRALILPAFGSYAGGLDVDDPAIGALFEGAFAALVPTAQGLARFARPAVAKMSQDCDEIAR